MNKRLFVFSLFIFCFLSFPLYAAIPIPGDNQLSRLNIGQYVEFLEDKEGVLTIEDVAEKSLDWQQSDKDELGFGFTSSAYWFRFTVDNLTPNEIDWYFEISYPLLDYVDFYIPQASGQFAVKKTGDRLPFKQRDIVDRNFVFYQKENPGQSTYYIHVDTESSLKFKPILWSGKAYIKRMNDEFSRAWIFYGALIIMCIYNFLLLVFTREHTYAFLVGFIFTYLLTQMSVDGFAFQYLWPEAIWWSNNCIPFFICITLVFAGLFDQSYLNLREHSMTGYRIIKYAIVFPGIIWGLFSLLGYYAVSIKGAVLFVFVTLCL